MTCPLTTLCWGESNWFPRHKHMLNVFSLCGQFLSSHRALCVSNMKYLMSLYLETLATCHGAGKVKGPWCLWPLDPLDNPVMADTNYFVKKMFRFYQVTKKTVDVALTLLFNLSIRSGFIIVLYWYQSLFHHCMYFILCLICAHTKTG